MQMDPRMQMLARMMRGNTNPQHLVMSMLDSQAQENPMLANLMALAKDGKSANIEQIARNMLKSQGFDFDKEFGDFKRLLGL